MTPNVELEPKPKEYQDKLNTLVEQFSSVLDDFKKYYVFTNKNPEVNEYQHFYLENKSQLQNLNKEVFLIRNDIETSIEKLNYIMTRMNGQLSSEKELKGELVKLVSNLKENENGAETMLVDTETTYSQQYILNVEIFCGIILVAYLVSKFFKDKN